MKRNLLLSFVLFAIALAPAALKAQTCVIDSQYTSPGIYPSDTLPDLMVNTAYAEVVQFVFPSDTTMMGFTLEFDSFLVTAVSNVPTGLNWECDQHMNNCTYYTSPPALTRGCVRMFGTPTQQNAAYPGYDSVMVTGEGWVTVPFVGAVPAAQDIPVYYRTHPSSNIDQSMEDIVGLEISPNPIVANSIVGYNLPGNYDVSIEIYNASGKRVHTIHDGTQAAGRHALPVLLNAELAKGVYFVRFELNGGEFTTTRKLVNLL